MTIIDEGAGPDAAEPRARPWWFAPALVGVAVGALVGVMLLPPPPPPRTRALVATDGSHQAARTATPSPTMAVRPSDLPLLPQEGDVTRAMNAIGVTATAIGYSHFDRALGPALPARVFDLAERGGADVLFLDTARDIRVCATATRTGLVYRVAVDGHETSSIDAARPVTFLFDRSFFVIAWDDRAASMFQQALDLARAPC